jgi:hypothetical protein
MSVSDSAKVAQQRLPLAFEVRLGSQAWKLVNKK